MRAVDLHCDTIMKLWYAELRGGKASLAGDDPLSASFDINLKKLEAGGHLLQNFALFVDCALPKDFDGTVSDGNYFGVSMDGSDGKMDPWEQVTAMIRVFHKEMEKNKERIGQVRTYADIVKNEREGRISALLTTEEGAIIGRELSRIDRLYEEGVRMMTVTWNYENQLGCPNHPKAGFQQDFSRFFDFEPVHDGGLTPFGKEAVEKMAEKKILTDVSHLSDDGFYDVASIVKGPFVASHSNARGIANCHRNLSDDMIRIIAEHGGLIGLNFCPPFVEVRDREEECRTNYANLAKQARYIMNVGGREVLALGSDFDGINSDPVVFHDAAGMQALAEGLVENGLTEDEVDAVFSGNALRVYRDVLG